MSPLPDYFKTHTILVEPYEGSGAYGSVYGAQVSVECRVEDVVRLVRAASGDEVVSSATVACDVGTVIPPESRVTVKGRVTTVLSVSDPSTGGRSELDHLEIALA
jgi:hypothetical protein